MKTKTIEINPFCATLTIIFDEDLKQFEKHYQTRSLSNYGAVTMRDESEFMHYIVAFGCKDNSLIAHEIVHIINYTFLDCGVKLDSANDETQAYLTGWLFKEIEKFINT